MYRPLLALSTTLAALAFAGPAGASETMGLTDFLTAPPAAAPSCSGAATACAAIQTAPTAGVVAQAPYDGVVTGWKIRAAAAGAVRLRTIQPLLGTSEYTVTGAGPVEQVGGGNAVRTFAGQRFPIAQGGLLAVENAHAVGAIGSPLPGSAIEDVALGAGAAWEAGQTREGAGPTANAVLLVQATIEPDADGDGYGDETQDSCPRDFTTHAGPCTATVTFGSPLHLAANYPPVWAAGTDLFQATAPKLAVTAPVGGVITQWRFRAQTTASTMALQVLRGSGPYTATAQTAAQAPGGAGAVSTVPARIAVAAGDRLALRSGAAATALATVPGDVAGAFRPPLEPGETRPADATPLSNLRVLVQADIEPDVDGDGYGDVTQDRCPADAAQQGPCVTPPSSLPEPVIFVVRPCANLFTGTRDDDVLRGTDFGDRLVGKDGKDLLLGRGAADCLEGGAGADVLDGGTGDDRLAGGPGNDRLAGGPGADKLTGGRGNDRLNGGPGNDVLLPGSGRDVVIAGAGDDTINARDGLRETIDCGPGRDTVRADRRDRLKGCEKVTRR